MRQQYSHGGEIYGKDIALDCSINVNPLRMPEAVKRAVREGIEQDYRYPDDDCTELREAIAGELPGSGRGRADWVLCGNGAADLIYRYVLSVRPGRVLMPAPSFSEYEKALLLAGTEVCHYSLREESGFRVEEDILGCLEGMDAVFLCNPNNPVGNLMEPELLLRLLEQAGQREVRVFVDECFMEFTGEAGRCSLLPALESNSMLFILKAFTKTYAMAGLRLGYGVSADTGLLSRMKQSGPPWPVSSIAQRAGLAALGEREYLERSVGLIAEERGILKEGLERLGCKVYPSQTNYLMFRADPGLYDSLLERRILIRQCGNYRGLGGEYYRVCVGRHEDNIRILQAIAECRASGGQPYRRLGEADGQEKGR